MDPLEALSTAGDADNTTPEVIAKEAAPVPEQESCEPSNICDDRQALEQILGEDSSISPSRLAESGLAEPDYHQNLESNTKSKEEAGGELPQSDLAALQDMLDEKEAEENSDKLSLTENLSDVITAPDSSPSKLSDLKIGKTEHTFATHLEAKPSESPPLLLLQASTTGIDDGVFSTRELHQVPDQLLAEPCPLDRDDLDDRTENLIASNIEEQLREFEGSDDDSLLAKDCGEPEARLSLTSSLPVIQASAKSEDDTLKILSSEHEEHSTEANDSKSIERPVEQADDVEEEKSTHSEEPKDEDKTKESEQLDMSENENIPFTEVDVDMSGKEKSFDSDEKDAFADIHNEIENVESDAFADVSNEIENIENDEPASDEKSVDDDDGPSTAQMEVENVIEEANEQTSKTDEVMEVDQDSFEEHQEAEDNEKTDESTKGQHLPETTETSSENVDVDFSTSKSPEQTSIENELSEMDCDMADSSPKVIEIIDVHIDEDTQDKNEDNDSHNDEENEDQFEDTEQSESVTVPIEHEEGETSTNEQPEIGPEESEEAECAAEESMETEGAAQEGREKEDDSQENEGSAIIAHDTEEKDFEAQSSRDKDDAQKSKDMEDETQKSKDMEHVDEEQANKELEFESQESEDKETAVTDNKEAEGGAADSQGKDHSTAELEQKSDEAKGSHFKHSQEKLEKQKKNEESGKTQSSKKENKEINAVPNEPDKAGADIVEPDTSGEPETSPKSQSNEKVRTFEKQSESGVESEKDQDEIEVNLLCEDDEDNESQQKDQNTEDETRTEGADEEVCLLPDSEQEISEADKERATLAKEAARKTTEIEEMVYKEENIETESQNNDDCSVLEDEQSEPATVEPLAQDISENDVMVPFEIKELPNEAKQEKCFKCRKIKPCRYQMLVDEELKYLCSIKCVQSFRNTSKEKYNLSAKKIIVTATVEMKKICVRCKSQKNCKYQFTDPEFNTSFSYLCDARCLDLFIGLNVEKYIVRSKKYTVEEMCRDEQKKCLHCCETKACRYYFLHDTERFFICNETCFNLLAKEQPDRFRLKRRSVRVRDLRATPTSGSATEKDKIVARTEQEAEAARRERENSFIRRCNKCFQPVPLGERMLSWETMDFCNEFCLEAYQHIIGSTCTMCKSRVSLQSLGKYCVRFGFEVRQFCRSACLDSFKKGLKVCSFCQKDISKDKNGFLAPVGDKNQFKDFCTQTCMIAYEEICSYKKKLPVSLCAVCNVEKQARVEICLENHSYNFCSNPCFSAFKFVNNIIPDQCLMCLKYFERSNSNNFTIYQDQCAKVFCSNICLNIYIILNRKIVPCEWCKVKKYNFDMIQQKSGAGLLLMCSISCLTYYRTSLKAITLKQQICAHCQTEATAQYHLTMSDATIRNFCTYQCVMAFQSQFGNKPLTLDPPDTNKAIAASDPTNQPVPTGLPKRIKSKAVNQSIAIAKTAAAKVVQAPAGAKKGTKAAMPVIMNVSSLAQPVQAPNTSAVSTTVTRTLRGGRGKIQKPIMTSIPASELEKPTVQPTPASIKVPSSIVLKKIPNTATVQTQTAVDTPKETRSRATSANSYTQTLKIPKRNVSIAVGEGRIDIPIISQEAKPPEEPKIETRIDYKTNIISVPKKPVQVANKQTMCKPVGVSKGVNCRPHSVNVECQTDDKMERKVLIPIPVPIYVPQPMHMYSLPFPVPVPIPLPIPIPIFIPTTRNSAEGIMKEIRKIQEKMPSDPYEAELLMMAAMVADDKKKSESDSDSEVDHHQQPIVEPEYTTETIERSNSFGEDMLQMALKMATEYDEPAVDLESAMTTNTISQPHSNEEIVEEHDIHQSHMMIVDSQRQVTSPTRGRKRTLSPSLTRPNRLNTIGAYKKIRRMETQHVPEPEPEVREPVEKPDANMCLKYTFGVNAWKQWVMTKNADLEKSSIRRKPFKSELLQLTADELNYSLSLFVKEVRKPNGSEYAPDTIYYLVLGIQQYLYENNRIDNIFTDPYYERFTDCLDEVAKKFSVLYNDSQYIVTRVEEEHLWECKQLGAHSPHVLLSTLMFFNTKHFNLTTVEEHMQLSFSHIMKHWKRSPPGTKLPGSRNVLLRFYPPQTGESNPRKKKVYEQQENDENPLRCPVKLYEFYLSKCPESVKTRNDVFYLQPERSCVPDSPVWYSTQPLSKEALNKMLHRVKMVKEINVALLSS